MQSFWGDTDSKTVYYKNLQSTKDLSADEIIWRKEEQLKERQRILNILIVGESEIKVNEFSKTELVLRND